MTEIPKIFFWNQTKHCNKWFDFHFSEEKEKISWEFLPNNFSHEESTRTLLKKKKLLELDFVMKEIFLRYPFNQFAKLLHIGVSMEIQSKRMMKWNKLTAELRQYFVAELWYSDGLLRAVSKQFFFISWLPSSKQS